VNPKYMGERDRDELARAVLVALLTGDKTFSTNGAPVETPRQYSVLSYAFADAMRTMSKDPPHAQA
jgi:hypothetical protein